MDAPSHFVLQCNPQLNRLRGRLLCITWRRTVFYETDTIPQVRSLGSLTVEKLSGFNFQFRSFTYYTVLFYAPSFLENEAIIMILDHWYIFRQLKKYSYYLESIQAC